MPESQYLRRGTLVIKALQPLPGDSTFTSAFGPQSANSQQQAFITITDDLRFAFKWTKSWRPHPNVGEVTISNLSGATRAQIQGKGIKVQVSGGYGDNVGIVGVIDGRVNHNHPNVDWETKIEGRDGGNAVDWGYLRKSWAGKTPVLSIVNDLAAGLGKQFDSVSQSVIATALDGKRFNQGYTTKQYAYWELNSILLNAGVVISIQDDTLAAAQRDGTEGFKAGKEITLVGPESGLVGSPEYQGPPRPGHPELFKVTMLFNPKLKLYGQIQLEALYKKGPFKIMALTHRCDTYGGDWYTDAECQALRNSQ